MSSRDTILAAVRDNRPRLDRPLPDVPLFDDDLSEALIEAFKASLERMGGVLLDSQDATAIAQVRDRCRDAGPVCSTVPEVVGDLDPGSIDHPKDLADVDIAVVRARFGVAETGSVLLRDEDLKINALAYLAQHLVVLLDPRTIVGNLHHAYRRPDFREADYVAFHTGPSATADIEGVLIHGAQGVRSLTVALVAADPHPTNSNGD